MDAPAKSGPSTNNSSSEEARLFEYLRTNYSKIRLQRTSGILKKSWVGQSEGGAGYTWACLIPHNSTNKNAVVFHMTVEGKSDTGFVKVVLNISSARFKGRRGPAQGDFFFRLDVATPLEPCSFGPKDFCPNWKYFTIPGSFDISDDEKQRQGLAVSTLVENSGSADTNSKPSSLRQGMEFPPAVATVPSIQIANSNNIKDPSRWKSHREEEYYEKYKAEHAARLIAEKLEKMRKEEEEQWNKRKAEIEKIVEEEAQKTAESIRAKENRGSL